LLSNLLGLEDSISGSASSSEEDEGDDTPDAVRALLAKSTKYNSFTLS